MNVLHPMKEMDEAVINDSDMAGPLCFCLGMGGTLLLVRPTPLS